MRKWGTRVLISAVSTILTVAMPLSALADVNVVGELITATKEQNSEAEVILNDKGEAIGEEVIEEEPTEEVPEEEPTEEVPEEEPTEEVPEEEPTEEVPEEEPTEEVPEEEPTEEVPEEEPTEEVPEEEPTEEVPEEEPTEEVPEEEPTEEVPEEEMTEANPAETLPTTDVESKRKVELIFSQDTVELETGETSAALEILEIPEGYEEIDIEWSSSDDTIATVDSEGIITAVGTGSCVITAYLAEEEAENDLTVIVKEAVSEYDQIKSLTEGLESASSDEVLSEEELEQGEIEAESAGDLQYEYRDIAEQAEQAVKSGVMPLFDSTNFHNGIVLDSSFIDSKHVRGKQMRIPFTLYCFGVYSGDIYYVEVINSSGAKVADASGGIPRDGGEISLTITWTPTVPAGKYYIRFWASGRISDTYNLLAPFYIVENENIAAPKISKIVNTVQGSHVYWNKVSGAKNYTVYRSTSKDGFYSRIATTSAVHYTDTTVESGKAYYYKIRANGSTVQSEASAAMGIVFVDTPDLTLRVNRSTGIGLGWNKITGATGYAIYRKTTGSWVRVATITGNNTFTWTDTAVRPNNGTVYHYTIRALAGSNRKTLSGCRNTGRTMVRLFTPTISSAAKASATSLKVAWNRNTAATGYEVRLMVGDSVYKTYTYGSNKTIAKTITGLPSGKTYKVQVRSYKKVSGVGSFYSAWSAAKYVTVK